MMIASGTLRTRQLGRRLRVGSLIVALAMLALAGFAGVARADGAFGLLRLSFDPFTNTTSQHRTQVEPASFSYGDRVVSAFQSGRFFGGGASDIGWATSTGWAGMEAWLPSPDDDVRRGTVCGRHRSQRRL